MARLGRTWWGQRFIGALEALMDEGRLRRGRSYSGPSRLLEFAIEGNDIRARVRGNINPYFGGVQRATLSRSYPAETHCRQELGWDHQAAFVQCCVDLEAVDERDAG